MPINPSSRQFQKPDSSVIRGLFDSDPAIRWQVMRNLTDAPAEDLAAERARWPPRAGGRGCWLCRELTGRGLEFAAIHSARADSEPLGPGELERAKALFGA